MKNYYKTLGISQSSTKEEIKKAFRELAFKYHPDRNVDQIFSEKFKEINEAKQVLLNDYKKFRYDDMLVHFLSKNKVTSASKDFKRKRVYRRNVHLTLIKETIFNKFFLAILFVVTVLSTIAFYKIPDEEATLESPFITKSVSQSEKEPLKTQPLTSLLYTPEKVAEKELINVEIEKKPLKPKKIVGASYLNKKAGRKHAFNSKIKKNKHYVVVRKKEVKKKLTVRMPSAPPRINNEKLLRKQLTYNQMIEVLNQIKAEKRKTASNSNCVQLIKSETSNISNVFMLAHFLKGYGFIISGREKIPATINGIDIYVTNQCITISVGTL